MQLLRLQQLVSEYLLYVQETLHKRTTTLEGALGAAQSQLRDQAEYIGVLESQLRAKGGALPEKTVPVSQCGVCSKAFASDSYLQAHLRRRHPGYVQPVTCQPVTKPAVTSTASTALATVEEKKAAAPAPPPPPPPPPPSRLAASSSRSMTMPLVSHASASWPSWSCA